MHKQAATPRGAVVLVPFPFTDLTAVKVRPAVVISTNNNRGNDVIAVFISSNVPRKLFPEDVAVTSVNELRAMGLKVPSVIRCRKIVTLDR
ncbi:MAG: type II toxin-antitoxin system PemK/MazF family toxin, partial [bacterium]|nr:type II toxin-antitoxin system PemK/MazF family toxin [bacterium]